MEQNTKKMTVVLIIIGLVIGSAVGYLLAPRKVETVETKTTVTKNPLEDTTFKLGFICSNTARTEGEFVIMNKLIPPDVDEYLEKLGCNMNYEVFIDDANSQIAIHLEKVQAFKSMGINLMIAGEWSSQAEGALSYVNENKMFMLSPSATSPILSIADDNLYRLCPNDFASAPVVADILWSWGIKAVVIFQSGDAWADGLTNVVKVEYPKLGGVILETIRYSPEVKEFSTYLDTMNSIVKDAIETYGVEHVGVVLFPIGEASVIVSQSADYPILQSIIWMGTESIGRNQRVLDDAADEALPLRLFGAMMAPAASWKWDRHVKRYEAETGMLADFYSGILEDCVWTMLKSVLESGSYDADDVIALFPDISSSYYGVTGWCDLNEYGDRKPGIYEIWGYASDNGKVYPLKYGEVDAPIHKVVWNLEALQSQGLSQPGH